MDVDEITHPALGNEGQTNAVSLNPQMLSDSPAERPPMLRHLSSPGYQSPIRHHTRTRSSAREVKETLNARSEYSNSGDDGQAEHRINQYLIKQEIGRGSFGAVHLAVDQFGNEYAVKEFSKSRLRKRAQSHILRRPNSGRRPGHLAADSGLNSPLHRRSVSDVHQEQEAGNPLYLIREEIAIMKKLNHHNLVQLIEVLDDPEEDSLYMVLEMCKKGVVMKVGLGERADPYAEEDCRCWFRDLILGIEYLHAQGVVHRDIKPDNLLLTHDDVLKIVDFGVSEMFEKSSEMLTAKSAGSPAFLPPELCVVKHGEISGKAADIWAMGVTLYCLRFGKLPFEKSGVMELYEAIKNDEVVYTPNTDPVFMDLLNGILEKDPVKRIKMPELRNHPWVTKGGTDMLLSTEENTANLVEPPTDAEVKSAITDNIKNAIVVVRSPPLINPAAEIDSMQMKAVKKFKNLIFKNRPDLIDGILGGQVRIVQPPLSMSPSRAFQRSKSLDSDDRGHVESGLSSKGVHRDAGKASLTRASPPKEDAVEPLPKIQAPEKAGTLDDQFLPDQILPKSPLSAADSATSPPVTDRVPDPGKGHAHDPLGEEPLYLNVGAGGEDAELEPSYKVSESPPATDINVYETAYRHEVDRIRQKQGHNATIYLTRRVEAQEGGEAQEGSTTAEWERLLAKARNRD